MKYMHWMSRLGLVVLLVAASGGAHGAQNPLGLAKAKGELPEGYVVAGQSDMGRALVVSKANVTSARKMMAGTVADLGGCFDDLKLDAVYGDKDDRSALTSFNAKLNGREMKGTIFSSVGEKGATANVVFDRQDASAAEMARLAAATVPVGNLRWGVERIPDGSGTLNLPENWKITGASRGGVDVAGPLGESISLGIGFTIFTPQAEAYIEQQRRQVGMRGPTGFLIAPYCEPVEAVKALVPQFSRMSKAAGQVEFKLVKVIEAAPVEDRLGKTAYLHLVVEFGSGKQAWRQESLALVKCMPMGMGRWQYYYSQVASPEALFQRDLPTMVKIWQSWTLDPANVAERMNKAIAMMGKTREILARGAAKQDQARAQSSAEWDSIISGYATVVDKATGNQIDVNSSKVKETVEKMNDKAGYGKFKEVKLGE